MRGGKRDGWMKAMREEIAALQSNDVWTIVKRAPGTHVLRTKWVYKTKTDAQGNLERLKARLVADGSLNGQGILALAATWGVPAKHSDIPNAYVKAEKEAHLRIFLQMPRGMQVTEETLRTHGATSASELVLELRKSLYGLKQAGRLGSLLLHAKLVDAGTSAAAVESLFKSLASLSIKDLVQFSKLLGMRVQLASEGGYKLDQEEAIGDLVRDNGLVDANPTRTPIGDDCYEIEANDTTLLGTTGAKTGATVRDFQSLVGSLLWVARCTHPDIAFAVHKATCQMHAPRVHVWKMAKRVARYLKSTAAFKIAMKPEYDGDGTMRLEAFSDADYAADKSDRKSMTGGVVRLNGMAVSWSARKQGGVALSTMEAEFVTASEVAHEVLGLREMLREVGLDPALPMQLHVVNQAAISQIANEASSLKAKRVDVRLKFLCDFARRGVVVAICVRSEKMLVDLMTKALDATKLRTLRELMCIG
uniref:Reverse transcriptase Ty1/copia-type domain-containing protein n=2 Tax=Peronospora matthiolae TaxID=2874970 RepID=A0AAV1V3X7_9STRA